MKLTKDQVKKVAKLANLQLTDTEEELYTEQISEILEYIKKLEEVDTEGVEPTFNVTGLFNAMRTDESSECLTQEKALQNAPKVKRNMFATTGVFKEA